MDNFANDLRFYAVKSALHAIDGILAQIEICSWILTIVCVGLMFIVCKNEKKDTCKDGEQG